MLFDYVYAVVCPQCGDSAFNLYDWGIEQPICAACARASLYVVRGTIQCQECKNFTVIEKSSLLIVEKDNKRVKIIDEYLYCSDCEAEGVTQGQLNMKNYRLAIALKRYKKPIKKAST